MEWKNIVGFEGLYEISNTGIIKSIKKKRTMPNRWDNNNPNIRIYPAQEKITTINKDGYKTITLYKNNKASHCLVHRLVGFAFVEGYFEGAIINHIDGDKTNNNDWNLEWTTSLGNTNHAYEKGLMRDRNGNKRAKKLFTDQEVRNLRELFKDKLITAKQISKEYECNVKYVRQILKGNRYKHV